MRNAFKVSIIFLVVLLVTVNLGLNLLFLFAGISAGGVGCTLLACPCELQDDDFTGEVSCNSCFGSNGPVLFTGVFNLYKSCDGQEVLVCEEGIQVDERIDWDCRYTYNFFGISS
ncbi:MAG: hypothetical protein WDZ69_02020 [Candidatus Pacearchaeota archaeon]